MSRPIDSYTLQKFLDAFVQVKRELRQSKGPLLSPGDRTRLASPPVRRWRGLMPWITDEPVYKAPKNLLK